MKLTEQDIERFWSHVSKQDGCWNWTKSKQRTGYGQFCISRAEGQVMHYTHRLAYELTKGEIPPGLFVCHTCDNRMCCNPDHLYTGTQKENMHDMFQRKRGAGKDGYATNAKLTPDNVREIRSRLAHGQSLSQICCDYDVTKQVISYIKLKKTWAWVK